MTELDVEYENTFSRKTLTDWEEEEKKLNADYRHDRRYRELLDKKLYIFDSLIQFEEKGKYGLKSKGFNLIVVPAEYDSIKTCGANYFAVEKDSKFGVVRTGYFDYTIVYPITCDEINSSGIDLLIFKVDGKYGLMKMEGLGGREILEPIYDDIVEEDDEFIHIIKKDGKIGFYYEDIVVLPEFEDIYLPKIFGWIKVKKNGEWGYIGINREFTTDVNKAFLYYQFSLIADKYN